MDQRKKKASYSPPHVTKVVLKKEQAILSQCSVGITNPSSGGPGECYPVGGMPEGCKNGPPAAGDSGASS